MVILAIILSLSLRQCHLILAPAWERRDSLLCVLQPLRTISSLVPLMSPDWESPVQTQMAVRVLNGAISSSEYHGNNSIEGKAAGRRRVFVQTDTGNVLGIELDRSETAHTVKRSLQPALNVPTEESLLTFGDLVLKNDLSAVRNDSPPLLRRNLMHRSSSTPCLSPTGKDLQHRVQSRPIEVHRSSSTPCLSPTGNDLQHGGQRGPIEVLGCSSRCSRTKQLVKDVVKAINSGVDPIPVHSGLGGAYYFRNNLGESVAIVKPTDEEPFAPNNPKGFVGKALGQPGLKRSVRVGETGFREVAAYLLDHDHFANVPPTVLVKISHSVFHINNGVNGCQAHDRKRVSKIASFQQFIPHDFDASDHGTSSFPVSGVHRIGILDVRIFNTDRHAGNLLVRKLDGVGGFGHVELIPIDHGLCLPESLEDPYFEWIHWPQASIPFSDDELKYIENLDPFMDSDMLRMELPMIREACLRVLVLCTLFLKQAAAYGLCLAEIGEMMSREFRCLEEEPSELEILCIEAMRLVEEREVLISPCATLGDDEQFQFDIDWEETEMVDDVFKKVPSYHSGFKVGNCWNPLSKLEECTEEEEEDNEGDVDRFKDVGKSSGLSQLLDPPQVISRLSLSLKCVGLSEKNQRFHGFSKGVGLSILGSSETNRRSTNDQLPGSVSFVKVGDLTDEEWGLFLEKFQVLLRSALTGREEGWPGARQRQRLGTSCQF